MPDEFKRYRRTGVAEMRPYIPGENLDGVSVSDVDIENGSPCSGDMIARNPIDRRDQWLVAAAYFAQNFEADTKAVTHEEWQARINEISDLCNTTIIRDNMSKEQIIDLFHATLIKIDALAIYPSQE